MAHVTKRETQRRGGAAPTGRVLPMLFILWLTAFSPGLLVGQLQPPGLPVIPVPAEVTFGMGECLVGADTPIHAPHELRSAAVTLAGLLGSDPPSGPVPIASLAIRFEHDAGMEEEAYILETSASGIRILAGSAPGAFYAVQTLRQMLPACVDGGSRFRTWRLPSVTIRDRPRFAWRGVMLDCSRHFLPVADVKRIIERIAALKFNRLHWHLTDDQGWRLEIRAWPALTDIGAWRGEGPSRYGGYYTQDEIRDVVAYARERHITIVPEIDMPGHSSAALAALPWLGCTGKRWPVPTEWGIFDRQLCVGRESTFRFVEEVLREVTELFPSPWIHIGGDEIRLDRWALCDSCQAAVRRDGLPGTYALPWRFTQRVEEMLARHGRTAIGWNEIMAGATKGTVIQAWYDTNTGVQAAREGYSVISSPIEPYYLNYQDWYNTLEKVYRFDPMVEGAWPQEGKNLLGVECCLWAEYLPDVVTTDHTLFPRVAAVAEGAWSDAARKDWPFFLQRLGMLGGRWTRQGQTFSPTEGVPWDDGLPLTVQAFRDSTQGLAWLELSASANGLPTLLRDAALFDAVSQPPRVRDRDSTNILIEFGNTSPRYLGSYALRGLYKNGNPWLELADSTTADGLPHLPSTWAPSLPMSVSCYPNLLRMAAGATAISLDITLPEPGSIAIDIFDGAGRLLRSERRSHLYFGRGRLSLSLAGLPAGSYLLLVRGAAGTAVQRLLLLR